MPTPVTAPAERQPLVGKKSPARLKKEDAIRRKLQTYQQVRALSEGFMPTTPQIIAHAHAFLRSGVLDPRSRRLSSQGRTFIRDFRAWVEAAIQLLEEKNGNNEIQELIWHTSLSDVDVDTSVGSSSVGAKVTGAKDAAKASKALGQLATLIYGNPEFRKLLSDASVLARDIFADAASQAAGLATFAADTVRPSKSDLEAIDKPASESATNDKKDDGDDDNVDETTVKVPKSTADAYKKGKGKAKKARDDVEEYLRSKFPKQRQDAVINRLKKMVLDIQKSPEYTDSIDFLLELLKKYSQKLKEAGNEAVDSASSAETNSHFDIALQKAHAILLNFAQGNDGATVKDAAKKVVEDVSSDDELSEFFDDIGDYLQRLLRKEGYVMTDAADHEAHDLYERGQKLATKEQYKHDMDNLLEEVTSFFDSIRTDKTSRRVVELGVKCWEDVAMNKHGRPVFKKRVWRDLVDVVLPKLISSVKYVPVPRIEFQDANVDLVVENLIFESDNFLPHKIFIDDRNMMEMVNAYTVTSKYRHTTNIKIRNFSLFAKDVAFYVKKKTGLIKLEDKGFLDIFMDGDGVSAEITLESDSTDDDLDYEYFHVDKVDVTIHKFKYAVHGAEHALLATILQPFVSSFIKTAVSTLLEKYIAQEFERLDRQIRLFSERIKAATVANNGQASPEAWIRAVFGPLTGGGGGGQKGQYAVNLGSETLLPGVRPPGSLGEEVWRRDVELEEEAARKVTWRTNLFDV
ncbi:hypothetical protein YB2330_002037 [Saitoella coloradoensis]